MARSTSVLFGRIGAGVAATTVAAALAIAGTQAVAAGQSTTAAVGTAYTPSTGSGVTAYVPSHRSRGSYGQMPQMPSESTTTGSTAATGSATAAQLTGVVDIVTTVDYGSAQAAGTGIVLTSNGEILTNNHVIEGSTKISVTVLSTGKSYSANVIGTSPTNDVAVLKLTDATDLTVAPLGDSASVSVGDAVTGVGNAGNDPGTSAAPGTVTALAQSITASDGDGTNSEDLTGLIETNAGIQAGDSGGPLYDANGKVVGIDTAAQTAGASGQTVAGYAIPINHALEIADLITSGVDNETIHQGLPAFLGVQLATQGSGTTIAGTVSGSAAESAGLGVGDTITAIDGAAVSDTSDLTSAISGHDSGDKVSLSWISADGSSHSATVTLGSGPAD